MAFVAVFGVAVLMIYSPLIRCAITNPHLLTYYGSKDSYEYFKYKRYNEAPYGTIRCYVAGIGYAFGAGKTLFGVHEIINLYRQYNGLEVWCSRRQKFVRQRIFILSNVEFKTIPYEDFSSLKKFVDLSENIDDYDDLHDCLTVTYAVCDEASSQMNSRAFKSNFDPLFIKTLLTCRHFKASLFLTTQRFQMIDKLMRECVTTVVSCRKLWRFMRYAEYDPQELENAANETMIEPLKRGCWFVRDRDYLAYDTHACVADLKKACENGDMMSPEEILAMLGSTESDVAAVTNFSRKYKRRHKKMN